MASRARNHVDDLRGMSRLAVEATAGVTELVEAMHRRIAGGPDLLGRPLQAPVRAITGLVYGSLRGVARWVGAGVDAALASVGPLLGQSEPGPERAAVLAVLNGVLGDYLEATNNPLAISMSLRSGGQRLELSPAALRDSIPRASGKLLVLLHGSSMSDLQWARLGHDHGEALARELGFTALYLHYNSGLHISANGRAFSAQLEPLVASWPVPVEQLVLLGYSMGGLVARSACLDAEQGGLAWRRQLRKLVFLGAPHHGAPLERGGNWIHAALGVSSYSAPFARLGKIRSAGITDLRFGNVRDEDWQGRDRFERGSDGRTPLPLPEQVSCFAIAATASARREGRLRSDGLVPVDSALGRHAQPERTLLFPLDHQWIGTGMNHLDLLSRPEVYAQIKSWLEPG